MDEKLIGRNKEVWVICRMSWQPIVNKITESCLLTLHIPMSFWHLSETLKTSPCSRVYGGLKTWVIVTPPSSKPTSPEHLISANGTTCSSQNPEKRPYLLLVYFSLFLSHTVLFKHAELLSSSKVLFFPLSFRPWNMALNTLSPSSWICNNASCSS